LAESTYASAARALLPRTGLINCLWARVMRRTLRKSSVIAGKMALSLLMGGLCSQSVAGQEQTQANTSSSARAPEANQVDVQDANQNEITAVPNRPTIATTAETVQLGVFEIEYGLEAAKGHQNINGLLKWGMVKNLELWFLNNPIERDAGTAGRGDSGAGFKYRFISQKKAVPTVSILYVATVPTATAGVGAGAMGHSVEILLSKDFGKHHFDLNFGPQVLGRSGASGFDRNYFSALSYSYPITKKWGYTNEIAGFSRANATTPATLTVLNAATYNVTPRLVLDCGVFLAAYGNVPRANFEAGVTYSIANLYHLHPRRHSAKK
jgi:hypothetical protein